MARKFEVYQRVWRFDENRRVYRKSGRGGPIYEKHFIPMKVIDIQDKSYVIGWPDGGVFEKVGFAKAERTYFTDQGKADAVWVHDYRLRIVEAVRECRDANVLKEVAGVIGWKMPTAPDE